MAFDILRGVDWMQQQADQGRSRYADKLLGQAYAAETPEARKTGLAALAGKGYGQMAIAADTAFTQRDRAAEDHAHTQRTRQQGELVNRAKVLKGLPPQHRAVAWQQMAGEVAQIVGDPSLANMPYDPATFDPLIDQLAGADGKTNLTPGMASIEDAYRRGLISEDEYKQALRINFDLAPGASAPRVSHKQVWNDQTQQYELIPLQTGGVDYTGRFPSLERPGGPQASPPAPPPAGDDIFAGLKQAIPGLRITDQFRTPEENAALPNAADNSYHLKGQAVDIGTPSPEQQQQITAWLRTPEGSNFELIRNYADGHWHIEPRPGRAPAVAGGGMSPTGYGGGGGMGGNAPVAPPARPADPYAGSDYLRTNITQVGGGAIKASPSFAEQEAQKQREAAATARGSIEGRRDMGPDFEQETTLRKEFSDLTKEPRVVIDAYSKVREAAANESAAGDLSLIFAYMKMLDPNSVVRETEFANAQNAAGVPDQIRNVYNRAMTGERLGSDQRQDFVRQAETIARLAQTRIDETAARYRSMAPDYNMDPNRIAPDTAPKQGSTDIDALVDRWSK